MQACFLWFTMRVLVFIMTLLFITSCNSDKPGLQCFPSAKWKSLSPKTREYEERVIQELRKSTPTDFRYFFRTFLRKEGRDYILVNFRNEADCFDVPLRIDRLGKLAGMKKVNGQSYPEELNGIIWEIVQEEGFEVVKFLDMADIRD